MSRFSVLKLSFYCFWVFLCFSGQIGFTVAVIIFDSLRDPVGPENNLYLRISLIGACVLIFLCLLIAVWYRQSLKNHEFLKVNFQELRKPVVEKTGPKRTSKYEELRARREKQDDL